MTTDIVIGFAGTPFTRGYPWGPGFGTAYSDPGTLITGNGQRINFNHVANEFIIAHDVSPRVSAYAWTPGVGFGTKFGDPGTLPSNTGVDADFTRNGAQVAVAHLTSPRITAYPWSAGFGTKFTNPVTIPPNEGLGVAFHPANSYLGVGHVQSPFISVYPWSGSGFGTKVANPASLPPDLSIGVTWSEAGTTIFIGHVASPYVTAYPWTTGFGTKYSNPGTLPTGTAKSPHYNAVTNDVIFSSDTNPFTVAYPWSSGWGTKYGNPGTLPTGDSNDVGIPRLLGDAVGIAHDVTPFISVYPWSGGYGTKYSNPASLPDGNADGVGFGVFPDTHLGEAELVGSATITALGSIIHAGQAEIVGGGIVDAIGFVNTTHLGAVEIVGAGVVDAAGSYLLSGLAEIQGTSVLDAIGRTFAVTDIQIIRTLAWSLAPSPLRIRYALTGRSGPVIYAFRFERRTKNNQFIQDVTPMVLGCSIDANNDRDVFRKAMFTMNGHGVDEGGVHLMLDNPLSEHIAVFMDLLVDNSFTETIQMGLFSLSVPRKTFYGHHQETWSVEGNDNSIHLIEATITTPWTVAASTSIIGEIQGILNLLGISQNLPASALVTAVDRTWRPGATWSTIITELLDGANMYQLKFDRFGVARTRTRDAMANRTADVVYTGEDFILIPIVEESEDTRLANQVVAVVNDPNRPPLSSVATNNNPDSPISVVNLGRTITKVIPADTAADQSTLDDIAMNYLQAEAGLYRRATILTSIDPFREAHDIYELTVDGPVYTSEKWWCRNWRLNLEIGSQMSHTLGKVERIE